MIILFYIVLIMLVGMVLFAAAIACDPILRREFVRRWIGGAR